MKSKASAPGKVILFGEHFVVYGFRAILCAINRRVEVTARESHDGTVRIRSGIGEVTARRGTPVDEISRELRPMYHIADSALSGRTSEIGVEMYIHSKIPPGAGLGSSSACCVAGAAAMAGLHGRPHAEQVLESAVAAERTIFQNSSGADCAVSTYGGLGVYDKASGFARIGARPDIRLVVADSGMPHSTESVVGGVGRFREERKEEFETLCNIESGIVSKAVGIIESGHVDGLGKLASQNQELLQEIGVSSDELERMIGVGNRSAHGAKITGAGRGGCIISIVDEECQQETVRGFGEAGYGCFAARIDYAGLLTEPANI